MSYGKSSFAYSVSYSSYDFSVKQSDQSLKKAQINSSEGKALKGTIHFRKSKKTSFDLGVELIDLSLIAPSTMALSNEKIKMNNYHMSVSRYSKYFKASFQLLSEEIIGVNSAGTSIKLESSRATFGGAELSLLAKASRSYGLFLSAGYYSYISGDKLLENEIEKGDIYKIKTAFRYNSRDFFLDLFFLAGVKVVETKTDKINSSSLEFGITLGF